MGKIDLKKQLSQLYSASPKEAMVVDIPQMNFLMVDGKAAAYICLNYECKLPTTDVDVALEMLESDH